MKQYRKGDIEASGDVTAFSAYTPSDATLKTNIKPIYSDPTAFMQVEPITYNWIEEIGRDKPEYGFIAQDIQKAFPMLVVEKNFGGKNILVVDYQKATVVLWDVVKQLISRVELLEEKDNK